MTNGGRPVQGSAELTPRGAGQGLRRVLSFVWALEPALSFGQLAPIPIIHAAIKLRTWTLWPASALYSAATVLLWSAWLRVAPGRRLAHDLAAYFAPVTAHEQALLDLAEGPVLDVGCGPARHARLLQARVRRYARDQPPDLGLGHPGEVGQSRCRRPIHAPSS